MTTTKLNAIYTSQKSFYGKAHILTDNNDNEFLKSYDTIVCAYTNNGEFIKFWHGWSVTTSNHVNEFRQQHGDKKLNKKEWENLDTMSIENGEILNDEPQYKITMCNGFRSFTSSTTFATYEQASDYAEQLEEKCNYTIFVDIIEV